MMIITMMLLDIAMVQVGKERVDAKKHGDDEYPIQSRSHPYPPLPVGFA